MSHPFLMHLIIHMFNTSVIPYISLGEYLNSNLYTQSNMQNMRFFCCSVYILQSDCELHSDYIIFRVRVFIFCSVKTYEPVHVISNNVVCATSKALDQPSHMRSLIRAFAWRSNIL